MLLGPRVPLRDRSLSMKDPALRTPGLSIENLTRYVSRAPASSPAEVGQNIQVAMRITGLTPIQTSDSAAHTAPQVQHFATEGW